MKTREPKLALATLIGLLSITSGTCVQEVLSPTQEQQALDAIEKVGGAAYSDENAPGKPVTAIRFFKSVRDEDLDVVRVFPTLESLELVEGSITDAGLARTNESSCM
jgi:hypothetical protein